jgi:hypothetical protein
VYVIAKLTFFRGFRTVIVVAHTQQLSEARTLQTEGGSSTVNYIFRFLAAGWDLHGSDFLRSLH